MPNLHRAPVSLLVILGGFAVFDPPAEGSSIEYRRFLSHPHARSLSLPPLYERVPAHVPALSNAALIRLWEHNQFSPILRDHGIQMQLCQAVAEKRGLNPPRFDSYHPLAGQILNNTTFLEYVVSRYNLAPGRFVHYHHQLIPLIRGCALMMTMPSPPTGTAPEVIQAPGSTEVTPLPQGLINGPGPSQSPTTITTPSGTTTPPGGGGTTTPPGGGGTTTPPGGGGTTTPPGGGPTTPPGVPAPPSFVLMVLGIGYVATRVRAR